MGSAWVPWEKLPAQIDLCSPIPSKGSNAGMRGQGRQMNYKQACSLCKW